MKRLPIALLVLTVLTVTHCGGDSSVPPASVKEPEVTITTAGLPDADINAAYIETIAVAGGTGSYNFTIVSGTLPPGLTLNGTTGVVSGTTNSTTALYTFTVRAESQTNSGNFDEQELSIQVKDLVSIITVSPLPFAQNGVFYSTTINADGGTGSGYDFSVTSGALPAGLSIALNGTISGTPDVTCGTDTPVPCAGMSDFTVTAVDQGDSGNSGSKAFSIHVANFAPDSYEEDNDFTTTNTMLPGDSQDHNIHIEIDKDYIELDFASVTAGTKFIIETGFNTIETDTRLTLYNSSYTEIAFDDDAGDGFYSKLTFTCNTPGIYYALVDIYNVPSNYDVGDYTISITEVENINLTGTSGLANIDWDLWEAVAITGYYYGGTICADWYPGTAPSASDFGGVCHWIEVDTYARDFDDAGINGVIYLGSGGGSYRFFKELNESIYSYCDETYTLTSSTLTFHDSGGDKVYDWITYETATHEYDSYSGCGAGQCIDIAFFKFNSNVVGGEQEEWIMVLVTMKKMTSFSAEAAPDCGQIDEYMSLDYYY